MSKDLVLDKNLQNIYQSIKPSKKMDKLIYRALSEKDKTKRWILYPINQYTICLTPSKTNPQNKLCFNYAKYHIYKNNMIITMPTNFCKFYPNET
jgi:hypothetical protein